MYNRINNDFNLINTLLGMNRNGKYGSNFPLSFYQGMARVEQRNAELMARVDALYEEQAALEQAYALSLSKQAEQAAAAAAKKPKATLEDYIAANEKCRELNHAKLENAGNKIKCDNRMWETDIYIQTQTNMWVDFKSEEYALNSAFVGDGDRNAFDRQMINRQIENIFKEHGVEFPTGEELIFTIDPYDGRISVSGTENTALAEQVEKALNDGQSSSDLYNNGNALYSHIALCIKDYGNSQYDNDLFAKRSIHRNIRLFTGVDLTQCTKTADDYITADGRSVKQMVSDYFDRTTDSTNMAYNEDFKRNEVANMMRYDFSDGQDLFFQIRYTDTGLHDIGQENGYGTGQTGWIADMAQELAERVGRSTFLAFV